MTTLAAFTEMMGQFIDELIQVFPDEKAFQDAKANPWTKDDFMKCINPWATQMMQKDEAFFCEENKFAKKLNLIAIWKTDECTDNTKNAIWQYLHSMYMIATTMSMFPPETLAMIESAAEKCAKNFQGGEAPNEAALMAGMNNMLAQMLGGGGGGANPLAALMGGALGGPQQPPRQRKKKSSK